VLMVLRTSGDGDESALAPADDFPLAPGDELLLAGRPAARRGLETTMLLEAASEYVRTGRRVPTGWIWRRLTRTVRE
jgi:voltage-gated potassium channel